MKENCIFCDIVDRKIDSYVVYEDKMIMAILDIDPINEGHVLLITKEHYLDLDDIPNDVINHLFECAKKIVKSLRKVYNLDGYSIMQNGGCFNDIGHFHLHIFPRYNEDGFGWEYSDKEQLVSEEICDKIKNAINNLKHEID